MSRLFSVTVAACAALGACSGSGARPETGSGGPDGGGGSIDGGQADGAHPHPADSSTDAPSTAPKSIYTDLSAGMAGVNLLQIGRAPLIDTLNAKLLVVACTLTGRLVLIRCNLDGTSCSYTDISVGQGSGSALQPSAVIDTANGKLLVATKNEQNSNRPALYRCDLDGTDCSYTDISAGMGAGSGQFPSLIIDPVANKAVVVTQEVSGKPWLFNCNLDGTGCVYRDISSGQDHQWAPWAIRDAANGRVIVATNNQAVAGKPTIFYCDLGGPECSSNDISAGQGMSSGLDASPVIDTTNGKLLVATTNAANDSKPALFRCNLDGSTCSYRDISAGQGGGSGANPSAIVDAKDGKVLVVTTNGANAQRPALFRCNLDGTSCAFFDLSAGQGPSSAVDVSAVLDTANGNLLVVTLTGASKPALFSVHLW